MPVDGPYPLGPNFDEPEYPMNHRRRGKAIIFNHIFKDVCAKERKGAPLDESKLEKELLALGFDVDIQRDKDYEDIRKKLEDTAIEDHSDADCLVVVVMSHGDQLHPLQETPQPFLKEQYSLQQIHAHDRAYDEKELFRFFEGDKCQSLIAKPKIFFIQACRGDGSSTDGKKSRYMANKMDKGNSESGSDYIMCTLPNSADFLIFRATVDGTETYTATTGEGPDFIKSLCNELEKNRTVEDALDLESLLLNVKRNFVKANSLAMASGKLPPDVNLDVQMPCVYSTLLRKLYLKPK